MQKLSLRGSHLHDFFPHPGFCVRNRTCIARDVFHLFYIHFCKITLTT